MVILNKLDRLNEYKYIPIDMNVDKDNVYMIDFSLISGYSFLITYAYGHPNFPNEISNCITNLKVGFDFIHTPLLLIVASEITSVLRVQFRPWDNKISIGPWSPNDKGFLKGILLIN